MVLLILCLACAPVLPGACATKILYGRRPADTLHPVSAYIMGWLLCVCMAGAANAVTVIGGQSLLWCTKLFVGLLLGMEGISAIILGILGAVQGRERHEAFQKASEHRKVSGTVRGLQVVFMMLVLIQIVSILRKGYVFLSGDMTLETVQSFLDTNALYEMNPLTGQMYEAGVPLRIRILCLPTLYAMLCTLFDVSAQTVVWTVMPVYHLLCAYLVYYLLGSRLFPDKRVQRVTFLILAALVLAQGTYAYGADGLGLMYRGFRGESVRSVILLPYVIWALLERKWFCIIPAVMAEACIVWTLYGMGVSVMVAAIFALVLCGCAFFDKKHGKGDRTCGN